MRAGLFTGNFSNGRYAISIMATYYIEIKKCFCSAWNRRTASGKFQGKNQSQIFDQIDRWFCGEQNQKTAEPKIAIKSIGGFTVIKTDKRLQKFYRWFFGEFDWQLT